MMVNFVMIAMGLSLFSSIPKPDLVSVDIGSVQAGGGYAFTSFYPGNCFVWPQLSLSVGQARLYWGKKLAFVTGLELLRAQLEVLRGEDLEAGPGYAYGSLLMPQAGLSWLFGPVRPRLIRKEACLDPRYRIFYGENYAPRLDIVGGLALFNTMESS